MQKEIILSLLTTLYLAGEEVHSHTFIETTEGYLRAGYQSDSHQSDSAIGGKLHLDTSGWQGVHAGVSFYTTHAIAQQHDGAGVPLFGSDNRGYDILGEAYLHGVWGGTTLTIGRQEIDTPFADTDDIGMVPNTFEAGVATNTDLPDTTIVIAHLQKMAGVDAQTPEQFRQINGTKGVQALGLTYEGISDLALSGWYYRSRSLEIDTITYLEATYHTQGAHFGYTLGAQYAKATYRDSDDASIYGATASLAYGALTIGIAYNTSRDNIATNGWGGGPFFTSDEHLTIADAGVDGKMWTVMGDYDLSSLVAGVTMGLRYSTLKGNAHNDANEFDLTANYTITDRLGIDLHFSDIRDHHLVDGDRKNSRLFVNYHF